jgi:hypothetical protein
MSHGKCLLFNLIAVFDIRLIESSGLITIGHLCDQLID